MLDTINTIAQAVREGMEVNEPVMRLFLQAIQAGYTLGLADAQKSA